MANDDWGAKFMLNAANSANGMFAKFWAVVVVLFFYVLICVALSAATGIDPKYFFWGIPLLIIGGIFIAVIIGMTSGSKSSSGALDGSPAKREAEEKSSFKNELSYCEDYLEVANTLLKKINGNEPGIISSILDFEKRYIESGNFIHRPYWADRAPGYSPLFTQDLLIACWDGVVDARAFLNWVMAGIEVRFFEHELDPKFQNLYGGKKIIERRKNLSDRVEAIGTAFDQLSGKMSLNVTAEEVRRVQSKLLSFKPSSCNFPLACYFYADRTGIYLNYWRDRCHSYDHDGGLRQKAERLNSLLESAGRLTPYMDAVRHEASSRLKKASSLLNKKKIKPKDIRDLHEVADSLFPFAEGTELVAYKKVAMEVIEKVEAGKQSKIMADEIAALRSYLRTLDRFQS